MFKLFKKFEKKEWLIILFVLLLTIFQVFLELKMPDYMSEITSLVETSGSSMSDIIRNGLYMLVCALGSLITSVIIGFAVSRIASNFSYKTRKEVFTKVEELGMAEVKDFSTSSLITRTTNDITQIEMLIGLGMQLIFRAPVMAIWAITKILNKSAEWSTYTAIGIVILMSVVSILMVFVIPKFKKIQKLTDELNNKARENLTGIRVVRAFNAEKYQEKRFKKVNDDLTKIQLFNQRTMAILMPLISLVMYVLTLTIYYTGASFISEAALSSKLSIFSNMIVFSSYSMQVIMSFLMLAVIFMIVPRAQVSATRINEVLEKDISIKDGHISRKINDEVGTVEFRHVSFKYPDAEEYLLKNISFKVNKGETIAFIGSTGSGKSTLINLVPRFYDATEGEILVNGVDVREYKQKHLHDILGYVPQKAVLFSGTVASNVKYGDNGKKELTDDEIKEAIKIANAEDFVLKMENKYNEHIAQSGQNISGGQKQRLAIARAIARNPEIYIFDDSFSALDYKTDLELRKAIKAHTKDATLMIVAQRIGTIMNADKIVVLDKGKCVGIGTHKELLKTCDVYKEIALSQLSEEELKNA